MYPAKFDYRRATSVEEAVALLQEHGEGAKVLAGGHSLIPMMKLRLAQPALLVDIGQVEGLRGIRYGDDGTLYVGAMTTYAEIAADTTLQRTRSALTDACGIIGDVQVRNRGTIGGNLAHNDPASDLPAVALALDASLHIVGPGGTRHLSAEEFNIGLMETALQPGELVTMVEFPEFVAGTGSAYEKFENPASGYALCGVAALLMPAADGSVGLCRVAVTGAADHAQRLTSVEEFLMGEALSEESIAEAAALAGKGLAFTADIHADEAYRAHLTRVLTHRALKKAWQRQG